MARKGKPKPTAKPVDWMGSSKKDLDAFPSDVKREIGTALLVAQYGSKHASAKPLKGISGGVMEIVEDYDGDAYRAVYTVRLKGYVYVLHAFQKKSNTGKKTSKKDIELIRERLDAATRLHRNKKRPT